jgi:hypothetical protein
MLCTAEEPIQIEEARFAGKRKYNRGRLHINTETSDFVYSSIKFIRKQTSVFRIHCMQFLSGSTQYFLSNTGDHIRIVRSHIGRAPEFL